MPRDFYEVLGVRKDADAASIKKAYREAAKRYHPDRHPDDAKAEERFKEVGRAWEILGDPDKRKVYDELGHAAEAFGYDPQKAAAFKAQSQGFGGGHFHGGFPGGGFGGFDGFDGGIDLEELLSQVAGGRGRRGRAGPRPGPTVRAELTLDFLTAARGGERTLEAEGIGSLRVRIPAGVEDGGTLRLRGKGPRGPGGGPPGDLLLVLHVLPHEHFGREGDDLKIKVPITVGEALRGAAVEVPTLDGPVKVKVPAGTTQGRTLRLRGKGIALPGRAPGDLLVDLEITLPDLRGRDVSAAIDALEALYGGDLRAHLAGAGATGSDQRVA